MAYLGGNQVYDPNQLRFVRVDFQTTAAAEDKDIGVLYPLAKPVRVIAAKVFFYGLDTYASGVDIDLETDTGSAEAAIANYDTLGDPATAVGTWYSFTMTASGRVEIGEWLQLRVDDDEDAACRGSVIVYYVEEDA